MKLSFKGLTEYARSPQGKQALKRAEALNTPANRRKATQLLQRLRRSRPGA